MTSRPKILDMLVQYEMARTDLIMEMMDDQERWAESLVALTVGYPEFTRSLTEPLKTLP